MQFLQNIESTLFKSGLFDFQYTLCQNKYYQFGRTKGQEMPFSVPLAVFTQAQIGNI
jgi:hypothetical protein